MRISFGFPAFSVEPDDTYLSASKDKIWFPGRRLARIKILLS